MQKNMKIEVKSSICDVVARVQHRDAPNEEVDSKGVNPTNSVLLRRAH